MTLLTIERSATVGFCPVAAPFIAAGTAAGTVDISFSTSSVLEVSQCLQDDCRPAKHARVSCARFDLEIRHMQVFSLNFASSDASPVLSGAVPVPERFHRIAWGSKPSDATSLPVSECCCDCWLDERPRSLTMPCCSMACSLAVWRTGASACGTLQPSWMDRASLHC